MAAGTLNESKSGLAVRAEFANYLATQEPVVTQRWLELMHDAADVGHAQTLPERVLVDHLPDLYAELCEWLRVGQRRHLTHEARNDARQHGTERWKVGFRLEEVVRELDLLRAVILCSVVSQFREDNPAFTPEFEAATRFAIEEYFSLVTSWSIRQYVRDHESDIASYVARLEESNRGK